MTPEHPDHAARITWSSEQEKKGLPSFTRTMDPAWFTGAGRGEDGWSLACTFPKPPLEQGNPSIARVDFWMPDAPRHRLQPGVTLRLFERATGSYAVVEILD